MTTVAQNRNEVLPMLFMIMTPIIKTIRPVYYWLLHYLFGL